MRCLTLADSLRLHGIGSTFVTRDLPGSISRKIAARGHHLVLLPGLDWRKDAMDTRAALPANTDTLVADHYRIDAAWHRQMRGHCRRLVVIDDLANRPYDCDMIVDQTFGRTRAVYEGKVPAACRLLLGTRFALLRPAFSELRETTLARRRSFNGVKTILVSMGGSDPGNLSLDVLKAIKGLEYQKPLKIMLVLHPESPVMQEVATYIESARLEVSILSDVENMATLMATADLAVGASGTTTWERCALGLPSLVAVTAPNQREIAGVLQARGAIRVWDSPESLCECLDTVLSHDGEWFDMMSAAADICDGDGCNRVLEEFGHDAHVETDNH